MPIRKVELYDKGQLVGYDEITVSDNYVLEEVARTNRQNALKNLKTIKDKGKANWTNDDIKEALANFLDFVGIV